MYDVITVGSATLDAFIETDVANIVSVSSLNSKREFMAYPYGAKIEIDNFKFETGGGAVNAAVNFATLGLNTSTIVKVGDEESSEKILKLLKNANVDLSNVVKSTEHKTGFSIILTSFQGDRTVLAHRGANANMEMKDVNLDAIKNSKWLYLAPLNGNSTKILDEIADYAENNGVNLAINVGTSSIKQGKEYLYKILSTAEVVILNKDEATMLTGINVRPDTKHEKFSNDVIHPDIISMLNELHSTKSKIVIITDGKHGVYAYDGEKYYQCDEFPATVVSTLGAGDAFSSTFVASLEKTNWDVAKSLMNASVVAASVVEHFSAQGGFVSFEEVEKRLKQTPDFQAKIIEK